MEYLFSIVSTAEIVGAAAEYANWNFGGNPNAYSQSDMCEEAWIDIPLNHKQVFALNKFVSSSVLTIRSLLLMAQLIPLALQFAFLYKYMTVSCQDLFNLGFDLTGTNCYCATCTNCETVSASWTFYTCKYTETVTCNMDPANSCLAQSVTTCPKDCSLPTSQGPSDSTDS